MATCEHKNGGRAGFVHWLTRIRLTRLIGLLLTILIIVPLVAHYYISNLAIDGSTSNEGHRTRKIQDHDEISNSKLLDLRFQIDDLKRIKASVNNELRDLENRRLHLHNEISSYNTHIEELKDAYEKNQFKLEQLKVTIENARLEKEEIIKRSIPEVLAPKRILPAASELYVTPPTTSWQCSMHTCFDYSRCPLTSGFPVYLYSVEDYPVTGSPVDTFIKLSVTQSVLSCPHYTSDPKIACIYLVLLGDINGGLHNATGLETQLHQLPYWNGDGRNHILLNLARYYGNKDVFDGVDTGRAILVQSSFTDSQYREGFDLVIPPSLGLSHGDTWDELPPIVPASRRHLLSFQGDYQLVMGGARSQNLANDIAASQSPDSQLANQGGQLDKVNRGAKQDFLPQNKQYFEQADGERPLNQLDEEDSNPNIMPHFRNLLHMDEIPQNVQRLNAVDHSSLLEVDFNIVDALKRMQVTFPGDNFHFEFVCSKERVIGVNGEWCLCGADSDRRDHLHESTFSLIIAPTNISVVTTTLTQVRLYEALKYGAIPVILGDHTKLPFGDLLAWHQAVITLPKARITELYLILRSISDADILEMRRRSRMIWETYFGTTDSIMKMLLATFRTRLGITAAPVKDEPTPNIFAPGFEPLRSEVADIQLQADEVLGPVEAPFPSVRYRRNYTRLDDWFNMAGDPFHSYPFTPFEPMMPGEAKFKG